ncbi:MAG: KxYKxGKxW signal peptide domain-containing protein [Bacteroidales bacterium]|nr:KxYKxGKxW signal peptide domain-containing protein [Bacteroidales bacterium]
MSGIRQLLRICINSKMYKAKKQWNFHCFFFVGHL